MPKNNFIALNIDNELLDEMYLKIQELKQKIGNFSPYKKSDLHMTLCFLGTILKTDRNLKMIEITKNMESFSDQHSGKILVFDSFDIFKNLIVVKFKCEENPEKFVGDVIQFKQSFVNIGAKKENYFTPHITLGKIEGLNRTDMKAYRELINSLSPINTKIMVNKCSLV